MQKNRKVRCMIMNPDVLRTISYGLYAIGTRNNGQANLSIVNTVFQVTAEPLMVAVSVNKNNLTHDWIQKNGAFSVSVLSEQAAAPVIAFLGFRSGRDFDKMQKVEFTLTDTGLPVLTQGICCWFSCKLVSAHDLPTHTLFVGEVTDSSAEYGGDPMTYRYYHEILKGKASKNAPTFTASGGTGTARPR